MSYGLVYWPGKLDGAQKPKHTDDPMVDKAVIKIGDNSLFQKLYTGKCAKFETQGGQTIIVIEDPLMVPFGKMGTIHNSGVYYVVDLFKTIIAVFGFTEGAKIAGDLAIQQIMAKIEVKYSDYFMKTK
jgi:hypothetical protein